MCLKLKTFPLKNDGELCIDLSISWWELLSHLASTDSLSILQMGRLVFLILKVPRLGGSGTTGHKLTPRVPGCWSGSSAVLRVLSTSPVSKRKTSRKGSFSFPHVFTSFFVFIFRNASYCQ